MIEELQPSRWPIARISVAGVRAHRGRFFSLTFAIVIGVLFISATLTITDTVRAGFGSLFNSANKNVSVVVRQHSDVTRQNQTFRGRIDETLRSEIESVPHVEAVEPRISGYAYVVNASGVAPENVASETAGSPIAENWLSDEALNPFTLVEGTSPVATGDVVIDRGTAKTSSIAVGDQVTVVTKRGSTPGTVTGIVRFGSVDSPGAVPVVLFPFSDAQSLLAEPGKVDSLVVRGDSTISDEELAAAIGRVIPKGDEAVTGKAVTQESENQVASGLRFVTTFLLIFAVLSLLVGAFIIANTFAISVGQRVRELALLRAIGASRTQIGRMMLGEAFVMSIIGSVIGLFGGIALASVLRTILRATGVDLPPSPLVVKLGTVAWSLGIGSIVTLGAAILPAVRAARISPVAAMRDSEIEPPPLRRRSLAGAVVGAVGLAVLRSGANAPSLTRTGFGAILLLLSMVLISPLVATLAKFFVRPANRVLGTTTAMAVRNTTRNPRRTASTALALTMGSAVACFAVILNASLQQSLTTAVSGGLTGDLVIRSGSFGVGGLPPSVAEAVKQLPTVEAASGLRYGFATVEGPKRKARKASAVSRSGGRPIASVDPAAADRLLDFGNEVGKFGDLGDHRLAISRRELDDHGWNVGDKVMLQFPGKAPTEFTIATVFRQGIAFDFAIAHADYEPLATDVFDFVVYVAAKPGVDIATIRTEVEGVVKSYPTAKVEDPKQYVARLTSSLDQLLSLIFGLLVLVVVVAVLGITITLSLSVVERLREIGLLRTLGMFRSQVRAMLRWEAVLIAMLAVSVGVVLGTLVSWALLRAIRDEGLTRFAFPPIGVASLALVAAIAGLIASVVPGRRAANLPMLAALSGLHESPSESSGEQGRSGKLRRLWAGNSLGNGPRWGVAGLCVLAALVVGFGIGRTTAPTVDSARSVTPGSTIVIAGSVTSAAQGAASSVATDSVAAGSLAADTAVAVDTTTDPSLPSNVPYSVPPAAGPVVPGGLRSAVSIVAPEGMRGWQVLFDSTTRDGQSVVVSGLAYMPDRQAPSGGWPVLSYAHPTTGLADQCAQSRNVGLLENTVATLVGQMNMAVVASDYVGLGTEGVHPFFDGESAGRSVLDAVRAIRSVDPAVKFSADTFIWGHSQGGHAALFAGELAGSYAPELNLLGVVAGAPPSQLRTMVSVLASSPDRGYVALVAKGLSAASAFDGTELKESSILTDRGLELSTELETKCSSAVLDDARSDELLKSTTLPAEWMAALDRNEPTQRPIPAPVLIIHGDDDELVPVESSAVLASELRALGSKVERKTYAGAGHGDVVLTSLNDVLAWIASQSGAASGSSAGSSASAVTSTGVGADGGAGGAVATEEFSGANGKLLAVLKQGLKRPLVVAHAGGDLEAPHSTMYAFRRADALGADVLEMDVRLSKDNVLVVQHDPDVDRTSNETGPVVDRTAGQLAALDNAYWFTGGCWDCRKSGKTPPFRGVRTGSAKPPAGYGADDFGVSTVDSVLRAFSDKVFDIEIKADGPDKGQAVAAALAKRLSADPSPDRFIVVSFDDSALTTFRKAAPSVATSAGPQETTQFALAGKALVGLPVLQIPPVAQGIALWTPELRARAAKAGIAVWVWPIDPQSDDLANYKMLLKDKPNGIIAGRPTELLQALKSL